MEEFVVEKEHVLPAVCKERSEASCVCAFKGVLFIF